MCPRPGRPKAVNPKNIDIKVRVDAQTYEALQGYCQQHCVNRAQALRDGLTALLEKIEKTKANG